MQGKNRLKRQTRCTFFNIFKPKDSPKIYLTVPMFRVTTLAMRLSTQHHQDCVGKIIYQHVGGHLGGPPYKKTPSNSTKELQLETDFAVSKEFLPRGFSEKIPKKRQEKPMGKLSPRWREGVVSGFGWHPIGLTFRWVDAVMPCQRDPNRRSKLVENDSLISPVYDKDTILINKDIR